MLIQIHMLQNYAPSNLNRDDTGAPKDAVFGGVRRGRISSQCMKRSIRRSVAFEEAFSATGLLGVRTKKLPSLIQEELQALGAEPEAVKAINARVQEIGRESSKKETPEEEIEEPGEGEAQPEEEAQTKQLIFIGKNELRTMAEKLLAEYQRLGKMKWEKIKIPDITKILGASLPRSVDIALFGRMTTSAAFEDVAAAAQVAHALSTHALTQEFDYYTAVDDLSGESGAGMIGDVEFNSSTYYKYFNIHWEQLVKNLGGDAEVARQAVVAFVEAAATAQPSGKQNTFAANNLPDLVLVEVSKANLPVSYANAFVKPVRASAAISLMGASLKSLGDYLGIVRRKYSLQAERAFLSLEPVEFPDAVEANSLGELKAWLAERLPDGG